MIDVAEKKSTKIPESILRQYVDADEYVEFNKADRTLRTITVRLPKPPPIEEIDGYGLPAKEQYWSPPVMPIKLKRLERVSETLDDIWEALELQPEYYEDEINWIKTQWDRIENGYWLFINGKPTYMDGWHYMFAGFWHLDVGLPEYRDRDRRFFLFARYCYTTHDAFYPYKVLQENEKPRFFSDYKDALAFIKETELTIEDEGYTVDMGRRTCFGFNYPKHRREGATYKAECIVYCITTSFYNAHGGIQSMDGPSAYKAFHEKLVLPWQKLPFFFKPAYNTGTDPKQKIMFDVEAVRGGNILNWVEGLQSQITWANSAKRGWYDGDKLVVYHRDEIGKTKNEDVDASQGVVKKCLSQGNGTWIHGLAMNTSTVGEMSEGGGESFFSLCEKSFWEKRNKIGQTTSGLFNLFIPAYDGLEGYTDIFGASIIDDPTEKDLWRIPSPQRDVEGNLIGAKTFLTIQREDLLSRNDSDAMTDYEEELRMHPMEFDECFITAGAGSGLNLIIITNRIKEIQFDKTLTQRGNFSWQNGVRDSKVIWTPDPIAGRWLKSLDIQEAMQSQKFKRRIIYLGREKEAFYPTYPQPFVHCGDPYKFLKTETKRMSLGAGATFWKRDKSIDPDSVPIDRWKSHRFVCTYLYRPLTPWLYAEDMLMQTVYFGGMMFPEINNDLLWTYFVERNYDGYLLYGLNINGEKFRQTPGFNSMGADQQELMQQLQTHVEHHGMREKHIEILQELKKLKGVEDFTNRDLAVACGGCLMGLKSSYLNFVNVSPDSHNNVDVGQIYRKKRF